MHLIFVAIVIATVQPSNQMNTSEHQQTRSTIYDANVDGSNKTITAANNNNNKTLSRSRAYCNQEAKTLDHQGTLAALALSKNFWFKKPGIQPIQFVKLYYRRKKR